MAARLTVFAIHHLSNQNIGDRYCTPWIYFRDVLGSDVVFREVATTDPWVRHLHNSFVLLGGGGLLHPYPWNEVILPLYRNGNALIAWGIGHHNDGIHAHRGKIMQDWKESESRYLQEYPLHVFDLAGLRDWGVGPVYCPCSTCMHPAFDIPRLPRRDIVLYEHAALEPMALDGFPRMSNVGNASMEAVLDFLGSSELVITNSYHGAYWATLLGRKVLIYEPWCTKFDLMKYPHLFCTRNTWRECTASARAYTGTLEECRAENRLFASAVRDLLMQRPRKRAPLRYWLSWRRRTRRAT